MASGSNFEFHFLYHLLRQSLNRDGQKVTSVDSKAPIACSHFHHFLYFPAHFARPCKTLARRASHDGSVAVRDGGRDFRVANLLVI